MQAEAVNSEILKQVTLIWSVFFQLSPLFNTAVFSIYTLRSSVGMNIRFERTH